MRYLCWLLATTLFMPLRAQDAAALATREHQLNERAVQGLHAIADALQAQKQHQRAFELRRELLLEYSPDDAKARAKCGFTAVGDHWRADDSLLVLDKDLRGEARELKKIDQQLDALGRELALEHRTLAAGWTGVPDLDRAMHHWQRALRWDPKDKQALAALELSTFEGFRGDARAMHMLRRARAIRGAVDWLLRAPFVVEPIEGRTQPLLQAAGLEHRGVRSAHFEVWGSLSPSQLTEIAQFAERALLLTDVLFRTSTGERLQPARHRNFLFANSQQGYHAVLDQCASQFDAGRLAFLKNDVEQAFVEHQGEIWRLYCAVKGREVDLDQTVRAVVQDASGIDTDGLWEGIGHAACGFLFGRTLTFMLEQKKERTSASSSSSLLSPDLATWRKIAETSAWARSDSRTSELVLLSAARFLNEQRVKAWAISDYLLHWRPEWLLELDRCRTDTIHSPPDVEAEFLRRTQYGLPRLDDDWREFWAKGQDLRTAMAKDPLGDDKTTDRPARERARTLVDAVNEARAAVQTGPVGFYVAESVGVHDVRQYADQLVKAEAKQKRKPKEVVPMPEPPVSLGTTVFWSRSKTPVEAVQAWLLQPARRDVLLHPGRDLCGVATSKDDWLLDVIELAPATVRGGPWTWPAAGQTAVPGGALVSELGPRAALALQPAGKQPSDRVGVPLTLHYSRSMAQGDLAAVRCRVWQDNIVVEGVVVVYGDGAADGADGCVAFLPLAPLPSGAKVEVQWELPADQLPKHTQFTPVTFTVL